jgi:hypothetical protein
VLEFLGLESGVPTTLTLGIVRTNLKVWVTLNSVQSFAVEFYRADNITPLSPAELAGKVAVLEIGASGSSPATVWTASWDSVVPHRAVWTLTAAQSLAHGSRSRDAVLALTSVSDRQVIAQGTTEVC